MSDYPEIQNAFVTLLNLEKNYLEGNNHEDEMILNQMISEVKVATNSQALFHSLFKLKPVLTPMLETQIESHLLVFSGFTDQVVEEEAKSLMSKQAFLNLNTAKLDLDTVKDIVKAKALSFLQLKFSKPENNHLSTKT